MKKLDCGLNVPEFDEFFITELTKTEGKWERDILTQALEYVDNFSTAIDGGAHIGTWSIPLAEHFQAVHAFEPDPENYDCLLLNTKALPNVTLHHKALGAEAGLKTLVSGYQNSGMNFINPNGKAIETPISYNVQLTTIDSLELHDVGLIKLDLEGYEYFALKGAMKTIALCKPVLVLEMWWFTRYVLKAEEIKALLDELRYKIAHYFEHTKEAIFVHV